MHILFRNIQYKPRIWGLYFTSLFTSLGIFLLALMILSATINIFGSLFLSLLILFAMYGYFYIRDNRDEIDHAAKKKRYIKDRITSYSVSGQKIIIKR